MARSSLRSQLVTVVCALMVIGAGLTGCGTGGGDSDTAADATRASSGGKGAQVYARSCAQCHGADLRGTTRGPSQFSEVYEPGHHPDASYRSAIVNGVAAHHWAFGDMPPVEGLDGTEIDAVIAYIRGRQTDHGFEAYPPG